jgi:hypothetical protein
MHKLLISGQTKLFIHCLPVEKQIIPGACNHFDPNNVLSSICIIAGIEKIFILAADNFSNFINNLKIKLLQTIRL